MFTKGRNEFIFSRGLAVSFFFFFSPPRPLFERRERLVVFKRVIDQTGIGGQRRRISDRPSRSIEIYFYFTERVHSRESDSFDVYVISQPTVFRQRFRGNKFYIRQRLLGNKYVTGKILSEEYALFLSSTSVFTTSRQLKVIGN